MGRTAIIKTRIPKSYRHPVLDQHIRSTRTKNEARLMKEARKCGIPTPIIYDIDLLNSEIVMERVDGERVKDVLSRVIDQHKIDEICREIGGLAAKLHKNGIVHGDLTTSNMILRNGKIWLIDFSLGERNARIEELGVDLHLLKEAFLSAHSEIFDKFEIVLDAYRQDFEGADEVINRMIDIEKRGRYT